MCMHQTTELQNMWAKLIEIERKIGKSTIAFGGVDYPLSNINRTTRQIIS